MMINCSRQALDVERFVWIIRKYVGGKEKSSNGRFLQTYEICM